MNIFLLNTKDVYTITLGEYMSLVCDKRLSVLKKRNIPTPRRILLQACAHIYDQYAELTTDPNVLASKNKRERLNRLIDRHTLIFSCYTILRYKDSEIARGLLRKNFVISKKDDRRASIAKCVSVLKGLRQEIDELKKKKTEDSTTRADFERSIVALRKMGYTVERNMMLSEYIQVENLAREEYESRDNRQRSK